MREVLSRNLKLFETCKIGREVLVTLKTYLKIWKATLEKYKVFEHLNTSKALMREHISFLICDIKG